MPCDLFFPHEEISSSEKKVLHTERWSISGILCERWLLGSDPPWRQAAEAYVSGSTD